MPSSDEDEVYRLAASLLRSAREQAGLSQAQFADRVGVPRSMVSAYERGLRQATLPTLQRLLNAVGFELRLDAVPRIGGDGSGPHAGDVGRASRHKRHTGHNSRPQDDQKHDRPRNSS